MIKNLGVALCAGLVVLAAACASDDSVEVADEGATTEVATTVAATTTVEATTTELATTTTASATTAAATTAPATTKQATTTTKPAPTTVKAKPTTTAPLVSFVEFSVSAPAACPAPDVSVQLDPPQVTIKWKLAGVIPDDVYVAVDNPNGAYQNGLPTQGEISLSHSCDENQHTYYVVAVVGDQQFVKSKKV